MGRVATYRTRIAAGIVVNTLTEHERKLRRLHVHVGDDVAMSEDQEMGEPDETVENYSSRIPVLYRWCLSNSGLLHASSAAICVE